MQFAGRRVLPLFTSARFVGLRSAQGNDTTGYFALREMASASPLLQGLAQPGPAGEPRFSGYAVARAPERGVLARFNTGDPWLIVDRGTAGRGAILTSGLNSRWGDLAYRGIVVPLLHRLIGSLTRPVPVTTDYAAGPAGQRTLEGISTDLALESPDGVRHRVLPVTQHGQTQVDLGTLTPTGCWRIAMNGSLRDVFAVNVAPEESALEQIEPDELRDGVALPHFRALRGDLAAEVAAARSGIELDVVAFALALACITVELVLMRGIRPTEERDEAHSVA